jgi:hypothetical protein
MDQGGWLTQHKACGRKIKRKDDAHDHCKGSYCLRSEWDPYPQQPILMNDGSASQAHGSEADPALSGQLCNRFRLSTPPEWSWLEVRPYENGSKA